MSERENENLISLCDSLDSYYRSTDQDCGRITVLAVKSMRYGTKLDLERALNTLIKARRIYDASSCSDRELAVLYLASAGFYSNSKEPEKVDSFCHLGLRIVDSSWFKGALQMRFYALLGAQDKPLEEVKPFLDTAYRLARKYNLRTWEQDILTNLSAAYAIEEEYEQAMVYLKKALSIAKDRQDYVEMGVLYNNYAGLLYGMLGPIDSVGIILDSAIYFAQTGDDLDGYQTYSENKAFLQFQLGRYLSAYNTLYQSTDPEGQFVCTSESGSPGRHV